MAVRKAKENYAKPQNEALHRKSKGKLCQGSGGGIAFRKVQENYAKEVVEAERSEK